MFIRLLSTQIPMLWEQIKYAAVKVDRVGEKDRSDYLIRLLYSLLSDRSQCFVRFDESRQLQAIVITSIGMEKPLGDKFLLVQCVYSFQTVIEEEWKMDLSTVETYARNVGCKKVVTYSNNPRVFELARVLNFTEVYRGFEKSLEA